MGTSTASEGIFEQAILTLGFKNPIDFFVRFVLPIAGAIMLFFFVMVFVLTGLPWWIPYVVLVLGFGFIFLYPIMIYEKKRSSINHNMHYFITYAGTISTRGIQRSILFKKLAEKKEMFGEISLIATRINYFAKSWSLGFASTCKKVARVVPSNVLADFLDRFAIMMDLGQNIGVFIREEQDAVMEEYAIAYKKSLANIGTVQDIFVSLTMALGFMMSIGLLMPLIAGTPVDSIVKMALVGLLILDFMMFGFVKVYVPEDKLVLEEGNKSKGYAKLKTLAMVIIPASSIIIIVLHMLNFFPFIVNVAIGITPLFYIGTQAQQEENKIFIMDRVYPSFIRALGGIIEIKSGAMLSSVGAIRIHDFGKLNDLVIGLYRRLKTGNDKFSTWEFFGVESGSNLIFQFSNIFAESVYLGGDANVIGEIVSSNFIKLLSLRRLRLQMSAGVRGSLYGSLVGFTLAAYMSAELTSMLSGIFSNPMNSMGSNSQVAGILEGIAPTATLAVDTEMIAGYIGVMVIIHSVVSAIIIKIVDGGSIYAAFFDFVGLIWAGTAVSVALPYGLKLLLPGMMGLSVG